MSALKHICLNHSLVWNSGLLTLTPQAFPWCGAVGRWLTSERRADRQESIGDDDVSILEDNYQAVQGRVC